MTKRRDLNHSRQTKPPAVIIGGSTNAVSVARSLAKAGVRVYALGGTSDDPVRYSRHSYQYERFAAGGEIQSAWLGWLERAPVGAVVLPCDDEAIELVARNRPRLVELGLIPIEADPEVSLAMLDKVRTYELAHRAGVPTPTTVPVRTQADLDRARALIGFPCALKPRHSHLFARQGLPVTKAFVVDNADELQLAFLRARGLGLEMLLTEIIPGADDRFASCFTYLDHQGRALFVLTKRKLRQFPPGFGLATYHVTDWNPRVADLALQFFRGVGLLGLGNVEFKLDPRDGQLKLIECNYRFTAINELVRIAGIDLALLSYNRAVGLPDPPINGYRKHVYMWYPIEDTRAFLALRRSGQLTFGRWTRSLLQRQHFPVFRLDDPMPTLTNAIRLLKAARRLPASRRTTRGQV